MKCASSSGQAERSARDRLHHRCVTFGKRSEHFTTTCIGNNILGKIIWPNPLPGSIARPPKKPGKAAHRTTSPEIRAELLQVADRYERLAARTERRRDVSPTGPGARRGRSDPEPRLRLGQPVTLSHANLSAIVLPQ